MFRELWAAILGFFRTQRSNMEPELSRMLNVHSSEVDPITATRRIKDMYYEQFWIEMDSMNDTFATENDLEDITCLTPHHFIYKKMENLMNSMIDELHFQDIPRHFNRIVPSIFTGRELIKYLITNFNIEEKAEALHLANMLVSYGYIFCIHNNYPKVKDDESHYRLQSPYYWPSNIFITEDSDYVTYLQKKRLKGRWIIDYQAKSLSDMRKTMSRDAWEMCTERANIFYEHDKDNLDIDVKTILDSQEQAFWVLHKPNPRFGDIRSKDFDDKKSRQYHDIAVITLPDILLGSEVSKNNVTQNIYKMNAEDLEEEILIMRKKLDKRKMKLPQIVESYITYFEKHQREDNFFKSSTY